MARALKPQKVETWRHASRGVVLDFFLNRNDNTFFFEYLRERTTASSIVELRRAAQTKVDANAVLTWIPMITVQRLKAFCHQRQEDFIGFEISRDWIAKRYDGGWLKAGWDHDDTDADREMWASNFYPGRDIKDFSLPYYGAEHHVSDSDYFYLPYTDELWVGLEELLEKIRFLKMKLDTLLTTPAGLTRLAEFARGLPGGAFGVKALPGTVEMESPEDIPPA